MTARKISAHQKWYKYADAALGPEKDWPAYVHGHIYQVLIEKVAYQIELAVRAERKHPTPDNAYITDGMGNRV